MPTLHITLYVFGYLAVLWMGTSLWFFAASRVMHLKDNRKFDDLHPEIKISVLIPGYLGILLDIQFNIIFGTLYYLEPPREFLFTDRIKRWKGKQFSDSWIGNWRKYNHTRFLHDLNIIDPGHV